MSEKITLEVKKVVKVQTPKNESKLANHLAQLVDRLSYETIRDGYGFCLLTKLLDLYQKEIIQAIAKVI